MAALRWFFFALLTFGGGTAAGFALHPPQLGIPEASAVDLRDRLTKIQQYASEGRCDAVKGQLSGAQSTVSKLPQNTAVTVEQSLQNAIEQLRTEAISECLRVAASRETQSAQAQATITPTDTPQATPTPATDPTPTPTPEATSPDGGTTDPGSGVTPTPDDGSGGGAAIDGPEAAVRDQITEARKQYDAAREAWRRAIDRLAGGTPR
ncbi:MAG: hypothetical protein QM679_01580 [Patulibacter sp.]